MKYWHLLLLCTTLISCAEIQDEIQEAMEREDSQFSYSVRLQSKPLFKTDTTYANYSIYLEQNENDTLYGFNFKVLNQHQLIYHFNNKTYFFNKTDSSFFIDEQFKSSLNALISPNNRLSLKELKDTSTVFYESDGDNYSIIRKLDDEQEFKNIFFKYTISKEERQLTAIQSNIDFQFSNQFKNYQFSNFDYRKTVSIQKELTLLKNDFNLAIIEPSVEEKQKNTGSSETHFSNFKGHLLEDGASVDLDHFQSKLIVLDYWFMSCYPCIKSFPFLNTLSSQYPDEKLQVIGVNIIDDISKKNDDLKKFVTSNNIRYPNIITKENPMNITSHPSIFLIKNGEILLSFSGHNSAKEKDLLNIVEKELSELNEGQIHSEKIVISK